MLLIKTELAKREYYDFVLAKETKTHHRNYNNYKLFYIDVTEGLCNQLDNVQQEDVVMEHVAITGYDNFLLQMEGGQLDPTQTHIISSGDTFCLHAISGYTTNISYDIAPTDNFHQLQGGFYQGFFKLYNYPVSFFPNRTRKGWTFNLLLHFPITDPSKLTLNDLIEDNSGFIFYLGTRAENKLIDPTDVDIEILKKYYKIEAENEENLYSQTKKLLLNNKPYEGWFNIKDNIPYTGRIYSGESEKLYYNQTYVDIIDNAFGVRITADGRIGYRSIYKTESCCYTGETQNVDDIDTDTFVDYTNETDNYTLKKIITRCFTIEESYSKMPIINQFDDKFLYISVIFDRDVSYEGDCALLTGDYKKGTLSIYINGFNVYKNKNFNEVIPHVLDTYDYYQEGVPFNLSFGGGTQGLFDAIFLDENNINYGVLDKFFTGTFVGGVKTIEMFSIPLYPIEIREIISTNLNNLDLFMPNGGRRVFIKKTM